MAKPMWRGDLAYIRKKCSCRSSAPGRQGVDTVATHRSYPPTIQYVSYSIRWQLDGPEVRVGSYHRTGGHFVVSGVLLVLCLS